MPLSVIRRPAVWLLVVLCLAAYLLAVRGGIGLTNDSRGYLLAAERVAGGQGLTIVNGDGDPIPLTQFAPLYPLVLSAGPATGLHALSFAVWVNGAALLATLLGMRSILASATAPSRGLFALAYATLGVSLIQVFGSALSDGLFLAGVASTYAAYRRYAARYRLRDAAFAGACMSVAVLTRYAGVALVAAVGISLLWSGFAGVGRRSTPSPQLSPPGTGERGPSRLIGGSIILGPPLLAIAGMSVRNRLVGDLTARRVLAFHPPGMESLRQFADALVIWAIGPFHRASIVAGVVSAIAGCAWAYWKRPSERSAEDSLALAPPLTSGVWTDLGVFAVVYPFFIIVSHTFFDGYIPFDDRILSPFYVVAICLAPSAIEAARIRLGPAWGGPAIVTVVAFGLGCQLADLVAWVREAPDFHVGYASTVWRTSATMNAVRALPGEATIYTNSPAAIYLCAGRFARPVPMVFDAMGKKAATGYVPALDRMRANLGTHAGYIVYLDKAAKRTSVTAEKLKGDLPMVEVDQLADGAIYRMPPP